MDPNTVKRRRKISDRARLLWRPPRDSKSSVGGRWHRLESSTSDVFRKRS